MVVVASHLPAIRHRVSFLMPRMARTSAIRSLWAQPIQTGAHLRSATRLRRQAGQINLVLGGTPGLDAHNCWWLASDVMLNVAVRLRRGVLKWRGPP